MDVWRNKSYPRSAPARRHVCAECSAQEWKPAVYDVQYSKLQHSWLLIQQVQSDNSKLGLSRFRVNYWSWLGVFYILIRKKNFWSFWSSAYNARLLRYNVQALVSFAYRVVLVYMTKNHSSLLVLVISAPVNGTSKNRILDCTCTITWSFHHIQAYVLHQGNKSTDGRVWISQPLHGMLQT